MLQNAILGCKAFVPLCSDSYGDSKYTKLEFNFAFNESKPMIPIYHSGSYPPKALAMKFSNMNYVPKSGLVAGAQLKDWVDRASRELVAGLTLNLISHFL